MKRLITNVTLLKTLSIKLTGFGAVLILTGCSFSGPKPEAMPCPVQLVLPDANSLTSFHTGTGKDLIDVDHEISIREIQTACTTFRDPETKVGNMDVEVTLVMLAKRGPKNTTQHAIIPYFIAVTNQDRKVLYREQFSMDVSFEGNRSQLAILTPPIILALPIRKGIVGIDYRIYGGLLTTKDQLEYNRSDQ